MRCVLIDNPGQQSRLVFSERPTPICGQKQLLIRVKATALNRADLMQRQGKYPPPPGESDIPGMEVAGEVVAVGSQVKRFQVGDRIYGLVASGAYAEYCCIHQDLAAPIPDNWDFTYAVAIPEALMTAHATLFSLGRLKAKQTLLIHAAGSGISSLAIQMASYKAAKVITTASSAEKITKAKKLGASLIINYKEEDFVTIIEEQSVDLVVDFIGGNYFDNHLKLLKPQGKLIQIACMQGHLAECNLATIMKKRLQIIGFVLRPQTIAEKSKLWHSAQQLWSAALVEQSIIPVIDSEFKFEELEKAHTYMQNNAHFGKIVIRI
ncbi:NAD(P)H-quinone oxidoreductase [Legionella fairfieldensis]|uniref:NAD(P)H-quinone oxidoreductase n=1 Tax=Legionella fairfieldensis TaxID=45064 RepID=UPI00048E3DDC|nr:NAD(P)H-quinone oxidoreductase [Legionella fairfieldensis]